ncbi:MAG: thermonuclease family protein [Candidatus Entotheonellia bacterium]
MVKRWMILGAMLYGLSLPIGNAEANIYTWIDESGQMHFSDSDVLVPPEYRDRMQIRPSTPPSAAPPPSLASPASPGSIGVKAGSRRRSPRAGSAQVVAVLDGDTILIDTGEKVRYVGINAPESRHPEKLPEYCGREAFEVNRRLVSGKAVRLEYDRRGRDRYGRLLAYVYVDRVFVNAELVRLGYAQVSTYKENQRYHREFQHLQQEAIAARRGLWGGCKEIRPRNGIAHKALRNGPG